MSPSSAIGCPTLVISCIADRMQTWRSDQSDCDGRIRQRAKEPLGGPRESSRGSIDRTRNRDRGTFYMIGNSSPPPPCTYPLLPRSIRRNFLEQMTEIFCSHHGGYSRTNSPLAPYTSLRWPRHKFSSFITYESQGLIFTARP